MKKKVFISVPMKGRTDDAILDSIKRMHKIAEAVFNEKLTVITSFTHDFDIEAPKHSNPSVFHLGRAVSLMADADYFIGIGYSECFPGCNIERDVARSYNIPMFVMGDYHPMMKDVAEIERDFWNTERAEG